MRFIYIYLIAYFLLVLGAGLTLWQAGALSRLSPLWVVLGIVCTVGLGVMVAMTAEKSPVARD